MWGEEPSETADPLPEPDELLENGILIRTPGHHLEIEAVELDLERLALPEVARDVLVEEGRQERRGIEATERTVTPNPLVEAVKDVRRRAVGGEDPVLTHDAVERLGLIPERGRPREHHHEMEVGIVEEQLGLRYSIRDPRDAGTGEAESRRDVLSRINVRDVDPEELVLAEAVDIDLVEPDLTITALGVVKADPNTTRLR
jgi:hypothetical protein